MDKKTCINKMIHVPMVSCGPLPLPKTTLVHLRHYSLLHHCMVYSISLSHCKFVNFFLFFFFFLPIYCTGAREHSHS
jgi:hypothetical protein